MADSFIQVPVDSTGKLVDCEQLTVGANTVQRERHQLTGASAAEIAVIANANPGGGEYALVTRNIPSGTQAVSGTVTANAGSNLNTSLLALEAGGNLASIKAKTDNIPAQGQALAAASLPVVLTAAQISTLTPPAAITNFALETGGNLATLAGTVGSSKVNVNISSGSIGNTGFNVTPATSGGLSSYHVLSAASNNAASIKGSAGQIFGWNIFNNTTYPIFVKLYNKATSPAPATDNALLIAVIGVQAGVGRDFSTDIGIPCSSGIGIAVVKNISETDNTSVAASDAVLEVYYK